MDNAVFDLHEELEKKHWWFQGRRKVVFSMVDRIMKKQPNSMIVDVGCGTGGTIAYLAKNYHCLGIDASPIGIAKAQDRYPTCQFRLGCIYKDLEDIKENISLFLIMDVLEHVEKDADFLTKIVNLAKPGASILITVPAKMSLWSQHDVTAEHLRRYEIDTLYSLWDKLSVKTRLLSYFNTRLYPVVKGIRFMNQYLKKTSGEKQTDFFMPSKLVNWTLSEIFGGEAGSIVKKLDKPFTLKNKGGVSLIALLEKC